MIETLIPFILVAHVPIDTYDVYYGSQYTFNLSNTMEYNFGNVTQHVNVVAKLKCGNSGAYSLVCSVTDASRQWYQETGMNSAYSENPRYVKFPIFDVGPFQILFKDGKIHRVFVDATQAKNSQRIVIAEIAELLNIWWTNLDESQKGLLSVIDYKFPRSALAVCQSMIKFTKQKKIDKRMVNFKISSVGRRLKINSGVTYHFRKSQGSHLPCSKGTYLLYDRDNVQPIVMNRTQIKAKSSFSRIIMSEDEFVSFTENVANYCPDEVAHNQGKCHYNIHQRISLTLDSITKATTDLPTITAPTDVFMSLESTLVSFLIITR
ncbi:uncharacterized protein LOC107036129 [Diachasma alloeum]|uniref:uncharacterized protein LOC107036129 n=1 Tax=Diachasma alloeum TaxID=454923 RepID=UPI0007384AF6|nr:uncharacterized protein LOC107036129 [Diachasma alloeum]